MASLDGRQNLCAFSCDPLCAAPPLVRGRRIGGVGEFMGGCLGIRIAFHIKAIKLCSSELVKLKSFVCLQSEVNHEGRV